MSELYTELVQRVADLELTLREMRRQLDAAGRGAKQNQPQVVRWYDGLKKSAESYPNNETDVLPVRFLDGAESAGNVSFDLRDTAWQNALLRFYNGWTPELYPHAGFVQDQRWWALPIPHSWIVKPTETISAFSASTGPGYGNANIYYRVDENTFATYKDSQNNPVVVKIWNWCEHPIFHLPVDPDEAYPTYEYPFLLAVEDGFGHLYAVQCPCREFDGVVTETYGIDADSFGEVQVYCNGSAVDPTKTVHAYYDWCTVAANLPSGTEVRVRLECCTPKYSIIDHKCV